MIGKFRFIGTVEKSAIASKILSALEGRGFELNQETPHCAIVLENASANEAKAFLDRDVPCYQVKDAIVSGIFTCEDEGILVNQVTSFLRMKEIFG